MLLTCVSLLPENWYGPLNRLTAVLAGEFLKLLTTTTAVHGSQISIGSFKVNVISECSAIHLIALLGAFIFAFPAECSRKLAGFFSGLFLLSAVNIIRISLVTLIGWKIPGFFDAAHIYLGQPVMMVMMVAVCICWCRWISGPAPTEQGSGIPVSFPDLHQRPLFSLAAVEPDLYGSGRSSGAMPVFHFWSPPCNPPDPCVLLPDVQPHYAARLILADQQTSWSARLQWIVYGVSLLTLFQILFRMSNVWLTAFGMEWVRPFSQVAYYFCIYLLPIVTGLKLLARSRLQAPQPAAG